MCVQLLIQKKKEVAIAWSRFRLKVSYLDRVRSIELIVFIKDVMIYYIRNTLSGLGCKYNFVMELIPIF